MTWAERIALKLQGGLDVDDPSVRVGLVSHNPAGAAYFEVEVEPGHWVLVTVTNI